MNIENGASGTAVKTVAKNTKKSWLMASVALALALLATPSASLAGLRQPDNTPLNQFGFATGPSVDTLTGVQRYYDVVKRVVGAGGVIRTGLAWDPTLMNVPDFRTWSEGKLEPARQKDLKILPRISTNGPGGYRIPTDAQWTEGLRMIVRMYGPGGIYAKGGTYKRNAYTVSVPAHADFQGLTDFELWNEPDSRGNVGGAMTPAITARLIKIGSIAMREEAAKLGFTINIVGPGFDGVEVADVQKLWEADNTIFQYLDTLTVHAYSRVSVLTCNPLKSNRCVNGLDNIRTFLDTHGGAHVHLGTTEGGYSGAAGTCIGPQVLTEELQAINSELALNWIRARPYLDMDFWITYAAIDGTGVYGYACDSKIYDIPYWEQKLGVVRADLTLKPWGAKYNSLIYSWRP
jgi:hypothetical protein